MKVIPIMEARKHAINFPIMQGFKPTAKTENPKSNLPVESGKRKNLVLPLRW